MKFTTIIAGALFAISANAAAAPPFQYGAAPATVTAYVKQTVTNTQTVTKYPKATTVTISQTVTKGKTIYTTLFATVTQYKTKTKKVCPPASSATYSAYRRDMTNLKPRAAAEEPLYAQEFA